MRWRISTPLANRAAAFSVLGAMLCAIPNNAHAQTGVAIVDSAAVARVAYRTAAQATTVPNAVESLLRAARAWPTQPTYWMAVARMGARAADTNAVRESLTALSRMDLGASILADTAVLRMSSAPSMRDVRARLERSGNAIAAGVPIATLSDSLIFAEGVDADPRTGALYVASIHQRTILEVNSTGQVRNLDVARAPNIGAMLGVRVARDGASLYATTAGLPTMQGYRDADSSIAAIVRIRIADGAVTGRWDIPTDGSKHLLGDLAIADDGTITASDSYAPVLYQLVPGIDSLRRIRHPLFRSLQGVAPIPGTSRLIVADYSHGLLRVDADRRTVTRIADAAGSTSLGVDGISWSDGAIIAVQNGVSPARIVRFALSADHSAIVSAQIIDRQPDVADEPTIGTLWRGGFVYVANSQWEKYDDAGKRRAGTTVRATQLLCVPLTPTHAAVAGASRKGTRKTASAPPPSRSCSVSEAASP